MMKTYIAAGPTLAAFHESDAFVRSIRGPIGSGKSTACVAEILKRAHEQKPGPDGRRKTRWGVVRNTYGELRTTTVRTWHMWFPETLGRFSLDAPPTHRLVTSELDLELIFLALDRPEDVRKLLSLELTGAWVNEARETPKAILDALTGRVGRFPPMADGGPTWSGVFLDGMSPDTDHWLYTLAEEVQPEGYAFFAQPAGDGPDAENRQHLPADYYDRIKAGKDEDWIKVYVKGQYGYAMDGKPVYPEWRDSVHVASEALAPIKGLSLFLGLDFGLMPACVFAQHTARGQWRIIDELISENMGMVRFSELLSARLDEWYGDIERIEAWGDPAGNARSQTDERTCMEIVKQYAGIDIRPAPSNEWTIRREAVASTLNRLVDGMPGLLLSPHCKMLRKGFAGGFQYKRVQVSGDERFHDKADKNKFSHPHDALQYLMLGSGEGRMLLGKERRKRAAASRPTRANSRYDLMHWRAAR